MAVFVAAVFVAAVFVAMPVVVTVIMAMTMAVIVAVTVAVVPFFVLDAENIIHIFNSVQQSVVAFVHVCSSS